MATSKYIPTSPPIQAHPEVRAYLDRELTRISELVAMTELVLPTLSAEPARPENGMIVYADGTSWNPGSGEGFYGYQASAWVKL